MSLSLFAPDLPEGFRYVEDFIAAGEERALVDAIAGVTFADFEMHGVKARRRVAFFGMSYDKAPAVPIPPFLLALRDRVGAWADVPAAHFRMALINEYTEGAAIGWHRDAPQYDVIAGVSLLSPCRMKLRPYVRPLALRSTERRAPRTTTHEVPLAPRSAYLLAGPARSDYEHSIPPATALRYSITFRTLR
jgi:alkylated DNA repair dioxygenase AlkB